MEEIDLTSLETWKSDMTLKERENQFQEAWQNYWHQATTKQEMKKWWNVMFERVLDVCHNLAAKKLVGISIDPDEFENRYMNAVMLIMNDIKKGVRPRKLSSYCYLRVYKFLYDPINQFYDSQTTMDFSDKENEYIIARSLGVSQPL